MVKPGPPPPRQEAAPALVCDRVSAPLAIPLSALRWRGVGEAPVAVRGCARTGTPWPEGVDLAGRAVLDWEHGRHEMRAAAVPGFPGAQESASDRVAAGIAEFGVISASGLAFSFKRNRMLS